MWLKYNRILSEDGKQWLHPTFANDGRCSQKFLSPTDNTLFLVNTLVQAFDAEGNKLPLNLDSYDEKFNLTFVPDETIESEKAIFCTPTTNTLPLI